MATTRKPAAVFWFANGMAAVTDGRDQIPEFQGTHEETLQAFKAAGSRHNLGTRAMWPEWLSGELSTHRSGNRREVVPVLLRPPASAS